MHRTRGKIVLCCTGFIFNIKKYCFVFLSDLLTITTFDFVSLKADAGLSTILLPKNCQKRYIGFFFNCIKIYAFKLSNIYASPHKYRIR